VRVVRGVVRFLDPCERLAWLSNNLPCFSVAPPCLDGDEPAVFGQYFGQARRVQWVTGAVGSVDADIAQADDGVWPIVDDPAEELLAWRRFEMR
jgi:hypothetical protein